MDFYTCSLGMPDLMCNHYYACIQACNWVDSQYTLQDSYTEVFGNWFDKMHKDHKSSAGKPMFLLMLYYQL